MSNFKEDVSEEEIVFEKSVMEQDQEQYENSVKTKQQSIRPSSYQLAATHGDAQGVWTLTEIPTSTPLMAVSTYVDVETAKTEDFTVVEIPELSSPDVSFTCSSLSDELVERDVSQSPSLTAVSEKLWPSELEIKTDSPLSTEVSTSSCAVSLAMQSYMTLPQSSSTQTASTAPTEVTMPLTVPSTPAQPSSHGLHTSPELLRSSHPVTPKESSSLDALVSSTSGELTRSGSMKTDNSGSSTQSCKVPVAPRDEVVITIEDDYDDERMYKGMKPVHDAPCECKKGVTQSFEKVDMPRSGSMETDNSGSSTQSCKVPVAPRDEVVITIEDDYDDERMYKGMKSVHDAPCECKKGVTQSFEKVDMPDLDRVNGDDNLSRSAERPMITKASMSSICEDFVNGFVKETVNDVPDMADGYEDDNVKFVDDDVMDIDTCGVTNNGMNEGKVKIKEKNGLSVMGGGVEPIPGVSGEHVVVRKADMDEDEDDDTWSLEDNDMASRDRKFSMVVDNLKLQAKQV